MDAAAVRARTCALSFLALTGTFAEGPILEMLHRATKGTKVRVIRSFDFSRCDHVLVSIDREGIEYPFPDAEPFSSFERLAWAWHHRKKLKGILCEIKAGFPHYDWLDAVCNADVFFVCPLDLPDQLFVVPRDRIDALYSARLARNQVEDRPEVFPSYPGLAPYAVPEEARSRLFERLVSGGWTGTGLAHDDNPADWEPNWRIPPTQPLEFMFQFSDRGHQSSFEAVWKIHQWLREWKTQIQLHHVLTQPLAGDFVLEHRAKKYTVQHKIKRGDPSSTLNRSDFFDLLFWHSGRNVNGGEQLVVSLRDDSAYEAFNFDEEGAIRIVEFLDEHGDDARRKHIETMAGLLHEKIREPGRADTKERSALRAGESEETRRTRSRCHYFAMSFYQYVNADPDELNIPVACVYLNWDQSHVFGEAVAVAHAWTAEERNTFRRWGKLPEPLRLWSLAFSEVPQKCVILRFCCRDYHHRRTSSAHFPLQQIPIELPLTAQKFFLICAPDATMVGKLPDSIMLFPSGFIDFPAKAREIWQENQDRRQNGVQTEYQLSLLLGHTQDNRSLSATMVKDGVTQSNFWITPENTLRHLELVLRESGDVVIRHPEVRDVARLHAFPVADYVTHIPDILQASLDYGSVRASTTGQTRDYGFYLKVREDNKQYVKGASKRTLTDPGIDEANSEDDSN